MKLTHSGLSATSEEHADRFYHDLLGLEKHPPKSLSAALAGAIFDINMDMRMIHYIGHGVHMEIFVHPDLKIQGPRVDHLCLEVENREDFLNRAEALGFQVSRIDKDGKSVIFVRDFDGNCFEIKASQV